MTRKLIAAAAVLGAVFALTAGTADAKKAKTPDAYIDVDDSGTWTTGDADVSEELNSSYTFTVGDPASREPAGDLVIKKASGKDYLQITHLTGDVTIAGSVSLKEGGLHVLAPQGAITLAPGARVKASGNYLQLKAATVNLGASASISHRGEGTAAVRIEGDYVTVGEAAKITSLVNNPPDNLGGALFLVGHEDLDVHPTAKISAPRSTVTRVDGDN